MNETMNYIFGNLHAMEGVIGHIGKALKNQNKINKRVCTAVVVLTAYAVVTDICIKEQNKKIEELSKQIEELKESKGE